MKPLQGESENLLESALAIGLTHKQRFAYHEHLAIHLLLVYFLQCKRLGYPSQTIWTWIIHNICHGLEMPAHAALLNICQRLLSHRCEDLTPTIPQRLRYPSMLNVVGAIRLLVLWPAKAEHERIRCRLANESVENSFDFEALSYVWGDLSDRRVIEVDGVDFSITSNLDLALRHLRHRDSKPRVLWVDAVCIDQSNLAERSSQVQLIARNFSKAREVIVWLGPETNTTAQALSAITRCGRAFDGCLDVVRKQPCSALRRELSTLPRDLERLKVGYMIATREFPFRFTAGEFDAIVKLLNRPWFRRIWVIQEIAFAATVTVYCGRLRFRWDDLAFAAGMIRDNSMSLQTSARQIRVSAEIENGLVASNMLFTVVRRKGGQPCKLDLLLRMYPTFEVTDPRDRVYALLGLSTDFCFAKSAQPLLQPDYSLSLQQVYTYTTRAIIEHERNLNCLLYITTVGTESQRGTNFSELPSWVPDWRHAQVYVDLEHPSLSGNHPSIWLNDKNDNNSDCCLGLEQQKPLDFKFLADDRILGVIGINVDHIIVAAPLGINDWMNSNDDQPSPPKLTKDYMQAFLGVDSTYHCVQSLREAFWLMYIVEWTEKMESLERKLTNSNTTTITRRAWSRLRINNAYEWLDREVPGVSVIPPRSPAEEETLTDYLDSTLKQMISSAPSTHLSFLYLPHLLHMFWTSKGHIGLGPLQAREGDIVVVLLGGKMPFVLRKVLDYYWLLGQCKVDGVMNGEIIQQQRAGEYEFEEFFLI